MPRDLRVCVVMAVCGVVAALSPWVAGAAAPRPNVLLIFTDDHASHAISAYGSRVNSTPHLDRLAAGGARFVNAFVTNSICSPSRATLLTGQYSHVNGVPVFNSFDGSRDHLAKRMQAAGYHTAIVGKWHLGTDPTGFDRWIVLPGQGAYRDPRFLVPGGSLSIAGHCTQVTTELGLESLRTRPRDKPFFMMLHHKAPHREWTPDDLNRQRFADREIPEPDTLFDDYATRPAALPENQQTVAHIDVAPTILDLAGLPVPDEMQGRSMVPLLRGERPAGWRTSVYYRYYHDPGDHNTRAHYGVRTATHKLIHYWKKDAWELFDLVKDPAERHNLLFDPAESSRSDVVMLFAELRAELGRRQREYGDDGRYADPATWPHGGVNGASAGKKPLGRMTVAEAMSAAADGSR